MSECLFEVGERRGSSADVARVQPAELGYGVAHVAMRGIDVPEVVLTEDVDAVALIVGVGADG